MLMTAASARPAPALKGRRPAPARVPRPQEDAQTSPTPRPASPHGDLGCGGPKEDTSRVSPDGPGAAEACRRGHSPRLCAGPRGTDPASRPTARTWTPRQARVHGQGWGPGAAAAARPADAWGSLCTVVERRWGRVAVEEGGWEGSG